MVKEESSGDVCLWEDILPVSSRKEKMGCSLKSVCIISI